MFGRRCAGRRRPRRAVSGSRRRRLRAEAPAAAQRVCRGFSVERSRRSASFGHASRTSCAATKSWPKSRIQEASWSMRRTMTHGRGLYAPMANVAPGFQPFPTARLLGCPALMALWLPDSPRGRRHCKGGVGGVRRRNRPRLGCAYSCGKSMCGLFPHAKVAGGWAGRWGRLGAHAGCWGWLGALSLGGLAGRPPERGRSVGGRCGVRGLVGSRAGMRGVGSFRA